jgi:hypothetical protein
VWGIDKMGWILIDYLLIASRRDPKRMQIFAIVSILRLQFIHH